MRVEPTSAATRDVRRWVRAALATEGPTTRTPAGLSPGPADEPASDEADLLGAIVRQRVVEVLDEHSGRLGLPAGLAGALGQVGAAGRRLVALQLLELTRVRDLLDDVGVRFLAFKGPALALQATGDLGARGYGDLDVLIEPETVERTVTTLLGHGWRTAVPLPPAGSWAWRRIVHTGHELTLDGAACSVDLHWRLDPTLDALPSFPDLWSRRERLALGGVPVPALGRSDALAHACLNAAKDEWRWLRNLVDVHRLARLESAWESFAPGRLQLHALAVTEGQVGLPAGLPATVVEQLARLRPRTVARLVTAAERSQERPVRTLHEAPGTATAQFLRYQLTASASPRDVRRALGSLVLPGRSVSQVATTSAWVGVPVGLGHRVGGLARRSAGRSR